MEKGVIWPRFAFSNTVFAFFIEIFGQDLLCSAR
jgi:hypothetical protein